MEILSFDEFKEHHVNNNVFELIDVKVIYK